MMKMKMRFAFLLLMIVTVVVVGGLDENLFNQFTEEEYQACFDTIVCKLDKPLEFRRFLVLAGPKGMFDSIHIHSLHGYCFNKMQALAYKILREREHMPDAADTPEFWKKYAVYKCAHTEEKKKEYYNEFWQDSAEFLGSVCRNPADIECVGMEKMGVELNVVMSEYVATGDCYSQAAELAKEKAEKLAKEEVAKLQGEKIPKMPSSMGKFG